MIRLNSHFSDEVLKLIIEKQSKYRLFYALYFKHYEIHGNFFIDLPKFSRSLILKIADQIGSISKINIPSEKAKTNYRKEIREYLKACQISSEHEGLIAQFVNDLIDLKKIYKVELLKEKVYLFLKDKKIEKISDNTLTRIIKGIKFNKGQKLFSTIATSLDEKSKAYLDGLLLYKEKHTSFLAFIKRWPCGLSFDGIKLEATKLKHLRLIEIPTAVKDIPDNELKKYYRNISTKYPSSVKEMPQESRYAHLAVLCFIRQREITDKLVEMLIKLTHKVFTSGEKKLRNELSKVVNIKENYNKKAILDLLIATIVSNEENIVKEAIYPVISKETLLKIKSKNGGRMPTFDDLTYENTRQSYVSHYRKLLAPIVDLLIFNSNNAAYQPIIEALNVIKNHLHSGSVYYPTDSNIPIYGAVTRSHQIHVLEETKNGDFIKRIDYELCVLHYLRNKLRVKEVWVEGAFMYRNPEEDLPKDFEQEKDNYFELLNVPKDAKRFITKLKKTLSIHLSEFNAQLPKNKLVDVLKKSKGHIKLTPLKAQNPPPQLEEIKQNVFQRWSSTSLLDVLKETDLRVNFLDDFIPSGPKEGLSKTVIKKRLLLAILGYGTNTGLKSVSNGNNDVTYNDLQHIKLRYFDHDNFRQAIRKVVNRLLNTQSPDIWEHCTTSVASDSTHVKATDQNLISHWHPRYKSNGVTVYWHVDRNSVCIYSQLKSCISSEVASMIEGILRHQTDKEVDKSYVDTHGQSEVGFAFSHMLGFDLLPRLNNIHAQKLCYTNTEDAEKYQNLTPILSRSIKWQLIAQQYEQIVKYTVALKLGTTSAENIMKRFTRNNLQHPTYKALSELGKVIKTIFLCRYLGSEELRREIHEGLNVVERWNGINDFIFYGNNGKLRNNNPAEMELSVLCLHLLQLSITFINTLMLQQVLTESNWIKKMTIEDKRAITPLLCEHINPYGVFILNLDERLPINNPDSLKVA